MLSPRVDSVGRMVGPWVARILEARPADPIQGQWRNIPVGSRITVALAARRILAEPRVGYTPVVVPAIRQPDIRVTSAVGTRVVPPGIPAAAIRLISLADTRVVLPAVRLTPAVTSAVDIRRRVAVIPRPVADTRRPAVADASPRAIGKQAGC